jgi:WD40 repeat protein
MDQEQVNENAYLGTYMRTKKRNDLQYPKLMHTGDPCSSVSISPTGRMLACGSWDGIELWDAQSGRSIFGFLRTPVEEYHECYNICFSPDERYVATLSTNFRFTVWDTKSGRLRLSDAPKTARAACNAQGTANGTLLPVLWSRQAIEFSMDGRYVFVASGPTSMEVREVLKGFSRIPSFNNEAGFVKAIAPGGGMTITADCANPNSLRVWCPLNGKTLGIIYADHAISQWDTLYFSPDSRRIVHFYFAGGRNWMQTWNVRHIRGSTTPTSGRRHRPEHGPHTLIAYPEYPPSFTPDGSVMFLGAGEGFVGAWNVASMECVWKSRIHSGGGVRSAISPTGNWMVTIAEGGHDLRLWRTDVRELRKLCFRDDRVVVLQ